MESSHVKYIVSRILDIHIGLQQDRDVGGAYVPDAMALEAERSAGWLRGPVVGLHLPAGAGRAGAAEPERADARGDGHRAGAAVPVAAVADHESGRPARRAGAAHPARSA